MQTLSVRLFIRAEIHTKGNSNIQNSLIRIYDTQKTRTDRVRWIKNMYKAAFPCMRIIYPTDFVRTDLSRTDEMPYRKKVFP